jgi:hypothetical protein
MESGDSVNKTESVGAAQTLCDCWPLQFQAKTLRHNVGSVVFGTSVYRL